MKKLYLFFFLLWTLQLPILSQTLNPGDGVRITFLNITDEISGDYNIQQDGNIQLPFIGLVQTTNIDYKEIKKTIFKKYSELYKDPALTIQPLYKINILGEVRTPGYYYVTDIETLTGMLALAGGVTGSASSGEFYIIRNGEEINLSVDELIERNRTASDIGLQSGDRVFVPRSFWANASQYGIIISGIAVLTTLLVIVLGK
ncbi:MAG: polysaccharide biosynthesis/export family protein [Ignavibacterium sp.]|jgi:polysaccharide export outer membrane protein|nr:polysaccharide biosynthesis/export family protein [Ignavibacterium sp.]